MGLKVLIVLFIVCSSIMNYDGTDGARVPSRQVDWDIEEQLKLLNKQPIKTIQGVAGDEYDCIDIFKQPALDHPLLKNHKVQMKPSFHLDGLLKEISSKEKQSRLNLTGVDCPQGTIPIRRTQKKDLIRAKAFDQDYHNIGPLSNRPNQLHAILGCDKGGFEPEFRGGHGTMNVLNPRVEKDQISWSMIWVENRAHSNHDYITAGWAVAPQLYGDSKTRLYTYWESTSGGKTNGCINELCPGFVHIDKNIPLNLVLPDISRWERDRYELSISIAQDEESKSWWLTIPALNITLGYWPNDILPNLAAGATRVAFGGLTKPSSNGVAPIMGYGAFPDGDLTHSGYFVRIGVIDWGYRDVLPVGYIDTFVEVPNCYGAKNGYFQNNKVGYVMTYGGPGGKCSV